MKNTTAEPIPAFSETYFDGGSFLKRNGSAKTDASVSSLFLQPPLSSRPKWGDLLLRLFDASISLFSGRVKRLPQPTLIPYGVSYFP